MKKFIRKNLAILALAAGLIFYGVSAQAQGVPGVPCQKLKNFEAHLSEKYNEHLTAQSLSANGKLIRIYVADEGSYTTLMVNPEGVACVVDYGGSFELVTPQETPKGSKL